MIEAFVKRVEVLTKEIIILYELNDAEQALFSSFLFDLTITQRHIKSAKIMVKLLRAAAHYIESFEDLMNEARKETKK